MLERLTSEEIEEAKADYQLNPWGEYRADVNAAQIAAAVINMLRDSSRSEPVNITDLLLTWDSDGEEESQEEQTPEEATAIFSRWIEAQDVKVKVQEEKAAVPVADRAKALGVDPDLAEKALKWAMG